MLSAYLIATLVMREQETRGEVDVKAFYLRRILRIWPLYFVFLGIVTPAFNWLVPGQQFPVPYALGFLLFSGNWIFVLLGRIPSVALPLWSVSVEEQFYILWPLFSWTNRNRRRIALASLVAFSTMTTVLLTVFHCKQEAFSFNTFVRMIPICAGAFIAGELNGRIPVIGAGVRLLMRSVACLGFAICGFFGEIFGAAAIWAYPLGSVAAGLAFMAVLGCSFCIPAIEYLGRISYGLYVFHGAALTLLEPLHNNALRIAGGLIVTFVLASASYHLLERPFLLLKDRFTYVKSRPA